MATAVHILLSRDVVGLGHIGDMVKVRGGYARNFLFPRKLAVPVSNQGVRQFEHHKRLLQYRKQQLTAQSQQQKQKLEQLTLNIETKASDKGKLFGSVTDRDIQACLKQQGVNADHRNIVLPHHIKTVGLHTVTLKLEAGVQANLQVMVVANQTQPAAEEEAAEAADQEKQQANDVAAQQEDVDLDDLKQLEQEKLEAAAAKQEPVSEGKEKA
ncbi:MAG: 50S ribosomal protein L9 [Myxococcota bacterium]